ncbi:MAG: OmpA family protein [Bacteroidota bacterium]
MQKASLVALLALFAQLYFNHLSAQDAENRWAIGAGPSLISYRAHPGDQIQYNPTYNPGFQFVASRYLAGGFDFRTRIGFSPRIGFPTADGGALMNSYVADLSYNLVFKFNNGVFLRESARISPFFSIGMGGAYVQDHPDVYAPFGVGMQVRISPRANLRLQTTRNLSINKDYQQLAHAIAFVYNLKEKEIPLEEIQPEPEEKPSPVLASALMPVDRDGDGVVDLQDLCPDEPGLSRLNGCPEPSPISEEDAAVVVSTATSENNVKTIPSEPRPIIQDQHREDFVGHLDDLFMEDAPANPPVKEIKPKPVPPAPAKVDYFKNTPLHMKSFTDERSTQSQANPVNTVPAQKIQIDDQQEEDPYARIEKKFLTAIGEVEETTSASVKEREAAPVAQASTVLPCSPADVEMQTPPSVFFESASKDLNQDMKEKLDKIANYMQNCSEAELILRGHTDADGGDKENLVLSIMRAYNVKYYLVYEHGIDQYRISSTGFGEKNPLGNNETISGREANRRVDFEWSL